MTSTEAKQTSARCSRHSHDLQNIGDLEEHPINAVFASKLPVCVARDVAHSSVTTELTFDMPDSLSLPGACWVNFCGMCVWPGKAAAMVTSVSRVMEMQQERCLVSRW